MRYGYLVKDIGIIWGTTIYYLICASVIGFVYYLTCLPLKWKIYLLTPIARPGTFPLNKKAGSIKEALYVISFVVKISIQNTKDILKKF
jgi:hypothetical protein